MMTQDVADADKAPKAFFQNWLLGCIYLWLQSDYLDLQKVPVTFAGRYRAAAWAAWKTVTSERNNSELQDSMMNQGLTTEQIEAMKNANVGGEAIVNALLANSETFETKTEFSQVQTHYA